MEIFLKLVKTFLTKSIFENDFTDLFCLQQLNYQKQNRKKSFSFTLYKSNEKVEEKVLAWTLQQQKKSQKSSRRQSREGGDDEEEKT